MFTDIEGSTALVRRLQGDRYADLLARHHRVIRTSLGAHEGTEQGTEGDSFFATFTSPSACVAAAIEMQQAFADPSWLDGKPLRVRMGIHTGEASSASAGIIGYEVHRAARIGAVGHGGQVLVSSAAAALLEDVLPRGATLRDLGAHRLKDLGRPERLFQLVAPGMRVDFSPLNSLDNPSLRNNLPTELTSFVGREREIRELRELVGEHRLVTVAGPGGCGKTRLALQVAADLVGSFRDGVWLTDLAPLMEPKLVPGTLAGVVGVGEESTRALEETLAASLKDKTIQLVLDNCEHLLDAIAGLAERLLRSCPGVKLLATSREPLAVAGEWVFQATSLSAPTYDGDPLTWDDALAYESVKLFVERARAQQPAFDLATTDVHRVASICAHLDGIPLAIELAAARLRSMSVDDVERRLTDRFGLLTGGSRTARPRQQTLRALVDWSYDTLTERDRIVLNRLSVFVGGFSLDLAESVATSASGIGSAEVIDAVNSLVDKSLLQASPVDANMRYRMLETIREYCLEKLRESPEDERDTRMRHAMAFVDLFSPTDDVLEPYWDSHFAQFELELPNIRSAISFLLDVPEAIRSLLRLSTQFCWVAADRGYADEARRYLRAAFEVPGAQEMGSSTANAYMGIVLCEMYTGSAGSARSAIERGLAVALPLEDERPLIRLLGLSGCLHSLQSEHDLGISQTNDAVRRARAADDGHLLAESLSNRSGAYTYGGQVTESLADLEEALPLWRRFGGPLEVTVASVNYGNALLQVGRLQEGTQVMRDVTSSLSGSYGAEAATCSTLVFALAAQGKWEEAVAYGIRALHVVIDHSLVTVVPYCTLGAAVLLEHWEESRSASALIGASDRAFQAQQQVIEPFESGYRDATVVLLKEALGESEFEELRTEGASLDPVQALEMAVEHLDTLHGLHPPP